MHYHKFGVLTADGTEVEFRYDNVFAPEQTRGPSRLVIGPAGDHTQLLLALAESWRGPYGVLYLLLVGRTGRAEGRYQLADLLEHDELVSFLTRHAPFLESDGRHNIWIGSPGSDALLVYDQHDVVYAYGPLQAFEKLLLLRGFRRGEIQIPFPHTHHYHPENDVVEDQLMAEGNWIRTPLRLGD